MSTEDKEHLVTQIWDVCEDDEASADEQLDRIRKILASQQ